MSNESTAPLQNPNRRIASVSCQRTAVGRSARSDTLRLTQTDGLRLFVRLPTDEQADLIQLVSDERLMHAVYHTIHVLGLAPSVPWYDS